MEKPKQANANNKKGQVDSDGLSKKERRALKVQQKQDQVNTKQESPKENNVVKLAIEKNSSKSTGQLSEKELRKLEWEKKLAEQKKQEITDKSTETLSKAQLKQKRREQQEAQRLAKSQQELKPTTAVKVEIEKPEKNANQQPATLKHTPIKSNSAKKTERKSPENKKLQIVRHLYTENLKAQSLNVVYKNIHPAFVKLGVQYTTKKILGSNARCLALLSVLDLLVRDLQNPRDQEFCRYLESVLNNSVTFLQQSRPFAVSMSNALRYFKIKLQDAKEMNDTAEQRDFLSAAIKTYIHEEIDKAGEAISLKVNEKIKNEDVILTFGCSSLIKKILLDAHKDGKRFKVIVVDGRPLLEGRQMLQRLVQAGISCNYVLINAISYVMRDVTKVLLGAHALLTNGYVMSRIGTAQVALVAQAYNKPVLVCCETYKFSERVQTDSFVYNELGDTEMLTIIDTLEEPSVLKTTTRNENLKILNLFYDVTPSDLVTAVVTEIAILPCSSAPVVLRIKPTDFGDK